MNPQVPSAILDLLQKDDRQPHDEDELRAQLRAAASSNLASIPALNAALSQAAEIGLLPAASADALIIELKAIGAHAPTLLRAPLSNDAADAMRGEATLLRPASDSNAAMFPQTEAMTALRAPAPEMAAPVQFEPGAVIKGRFILKDKIGYGGMGIVFSAIDRRKTEARDPNPLVAIKVLNPELARHPSALMALQREARKAQTLAHPNVTTVFDFDRDGDRVYMSMELLRGRALNALLREMQGQGIGREAALPIIRGIAEGLAYAHRKGIVHSDLKPGNVFLTEDKTAKILDFGIARAVPNASEPKDLFDAHALRAYTEAYATAEMIEGADPHPADDVYALGLIAYQLFTGVHPYQHQSVVKAREKGLTVAQPKDLRRREWRVLERSLSFDRALRPRDAGEFLAQFFGVSRPQKALIAAVVLLGLFGAYATYRNYEETGPKVPFESLPTQTQQEFTGFMSDGDRLWQFYKKENNVLALQEAVEQYASAYALHPGNRQAVSALQTVADAALKATAGQPQQREFARALTQRSEYLATYPPVVAASK